MSFPRFVSSTAYEASHVMSDKAVTLYGLTGYNSSASAQFIQLHDARSVPAEGAVPVLVFAVGATSNFPSLSAVMQGLRFETGLVVCNSSTGPTKTLGSTDCFFTAYLH